MTEIDILQAINEFKFYKENGKFSSLPKSKGRDYARTKIGIYLWLGRKGEIDTELSRLIQKEIELIKGDNNA